MGADCDKSDFEHGVHLKGERLRNNHSTGKTRRGIGQRLRRGQMLKQFALVRGKPLRIESKNDARKFPYSTKISIVCSGWSFEPCQKVMGYLPNYQHAFYESFEHCHELTYNRMTETFCTYDRVSGLPVNYYTPFARPLFLNFYFLDVMFAKISVDISALLLILCW
jgi:hypothetical protein